eukprot:scaffold47_cov334-Pavlova_lutheri.AAC.42
MSRDLRVAISTKQFHFVMLINHSMSQALLPPIRKIFNVLGFLLYSLLPCIAFCISQRSSAVPKWT